jgi:Mrp family chromosome partitioning ATPase
MSSLDQAFIQAYSHKDSQVETMPAIHPHESKSDTTEKSAGVSQVVRLVEVIQRLERPASTPSGHVPTPHLRNLPPEAALQSPSTVESETSVEEMSATTADAEVNDMPALPVQYEETIAQPHFDLEAYYQANFSTPEEPSVVESDETNEVVADEVPSQEDKAGEQEEPSQSELEPEEAPVATVAMPQQPAAEKAASVAGPAFLAQWEVDTFSWPGICSQLIEHCQQEMSDLVDAILTETQQRPLVLSVSSCADGEGSSTLALCLAKLAAEKGGVVALVDGDHVDPRLSLDLDLNFRDGWEALNDDMSNVEETAIVSLADGVTFMPLRREGQDGPEAGKLVRLLATLAQKFPLVIVDLGPDNIAGHPWDEMSAAGVDLAAFIVRDARTTNDAQLATALDSVYQTGIQAVGVVENFVNEAAGV